MPKLKLQPEPVFKAVVKIPAAGSADLDLEFTFKHRTRDGLVEFAKASVEMSQEEQVLEMASGWELADEFSKENVALLLQNYTAAFEATWSKYLDELARNRAKN